MTVAEAARVLEVRAGTVYALCRAGLLAHERIGVGRGVIRITPADLDAYRVTRRVEASGPVIPAASLRPPRRPAIPDLIGEYLREKESRRKAREPGGRRPSNGQPPD